MRNQTVKKKFPFSASLVGLAIATFLASWARLFPSEIVDKLYSRSVFPTISHIFAIGADAISFSWLDVWIAGAVVLLVYSIRKKRWMFLAGTVSFFYLWFFWTWGLNYHRPPVADRLRLGTKDLTDSDLKRFAETAAGEINRLRPLANQSPLGRVENGEMAAKRVERVVFKIDGTGWRAANRVKRAVFAEWWYKIAGIDGMFNPFGHEPLVIAGPYSFELPFLMSHELAHVRGIANEGEANLVALLATVASEDPGFQYSGWLYLWSYLPRYPDVKLDEGPRADLKAVAARIKAHEIPLANYLQSAILDAHLKANAVPAGLRSYSEFVSFAVASQPHWQDFR
jgi:hypothetical protein